MYRFENLDEHLEYIRNRKEYTEQEAKGSKEKGKIGELEFAKVMWSLFTKYPIVTSTGREDFIQHWDMAVHHPEKYYYFDVKNNYAELRGKGCYFFELMTVKGKPGWGAKSSYAEWVAYWYNTLTFVIVKTEKMREILYRNMGDPLKHKPKTKPLSEKKPYEAYRRYDRKDFIIGVPYEDFEPYSRFVGIKYFERKTKQRLEVDPELTKIFGE